MWVTRVTFMFSIPFLISNRCSWRNYVGLHSLQFPGETNCNDTQLWTKDYIYITSQFHHSFDYLHNDPQHILVQTRTVWKVRLGEDSHRRSRICVSTHWTFKDTIQFYNNKTQQVIDFVDDIYIIILFLYWWDIVKQTVLTNVSRTSIMTKESYFQFSYDDNIIIESSNDKWTS